MMRLLTVFVLGIATFFLGVWLRGLEFYLFAEKLFSLEPWVFGAIAALSYPFFNYVDGIAKDASAIVAPEKRELVRAAVGRIDTLKREIVSNVLLVFVAFLIIELLVAAVAHLDLRRDLATPACWSLLWISAVAFVNQVRGFKQAVSMRSLILHP
jgi:hypothetical protein